MEASPTQLATITQPTPTELALFGRWTARGIGAIQHQLVAVQVAAKTEICADGSRVEALDTAGAWVLQKLLMRLRAEGSDVTLRGLRPAFATLLAVVAQQMAEKTGKPVPDAAPHPSVLTRIGLCAEVVCEQILALLSFVGESAVALWRCIAHPARLRWRPILFNIRSAGFDALPIVGLLSFLLGIVVAYQGADQFRRYGANIFVADLVGL